MARKMARVLQCFVWCIFFVLAPSVFVISSENISQRFGTHPDSCPVPVSYLCAFCVRAQLKLADNSWPWEFPFFCDIPCSHLRPYRAWLFAMTSLIYSATIKIQNAYLSLYVPENPFLLGCALPELLLQPLLEVVCNFLLRNLFWWKSWN
jgi:hypothetical protein